MVDGDGDMVLDMDKCDIRYMIYRDTETLSDTDTVIEAKSTTPNCRAYSYSYEGKDRQGQRRGRTRKRVFKHMLQFRYLIMRDTHHKHQENITQPKSSAGRTQPKSSAGKLGLRKRIQGSRASSNTNARQPTPTPL